jgi:hypothetical protein
MPEETDDGSHTHHDGQVTNHLTIELFANALDDFHGFLAF